MWVVVRWLGVLVGAISLFNLISTAFNLGVAPVFSTLLEYYQTIAYPLVAWTEPFFSWIGRLLRFDLPDWWQDALVVYIIIMSALARFVATFVHEIGWWRAIVAAICTVLWPVAIPLIPLSRDYEAAWLWTREVVKVVAGAALFLVMNAFAG